MGVAAALLPGFGTPAAGGRDGGRNTSIALNDHFLRFIERQVQGGRYGSASDVVRAGLRLLEEHEAKLAGLRAALIEGEESGPAQPFDVEEFLQSKDDDRQ